MGTDTLQILIAMIIYMGIVIAIGVVFAKRANKNSENYFLGGRSLGPWVTAMSAEASDMSGWLLMGLPGVAYWCGLASALWTAVGLLAGTYINWLIVSKRLRRYSVKANNSITLPEFFSNRFKENKKVLMTMAALFILIFFTVYAASCLDVYKRQVEIRGDILSALYRINEMISDVAIVETITGSDCAPRRSISDKFIPKPKRTTAHCKIFFEVKVTPG